MFSRKFYMIEKVFDIENIVVYVCFKYICNLKNLDY